VTTASPEPHPKRWLVLLAMTGSLAMIFLDVTVVGVALPRMRGSLGLSDSQAVWAMNAYTLTLACLVALGGRVADRFGRVRCFTTGVGLFALASLACGAATGPEMFLAGRVLQGVAAALMQPSSSSIVIDSFAPGERGKAMGVYIGIPMVFLALGPLVGGVLTEWVSWRANFLVNLPVAAAAIALVSATRPRERRDPADRVDLVGAAWLVVSLASLVWGLQEIGRAGWRSTPPLVGVGLGGVALAAFLRTELRRERPLLRLSLFRDRGLLVAAAVLFCLQFAMAGQVLFGSMYLQGALGFAPAKAGAALLPMLAPVVVTVHVAGRLYDRVGPRGPVLVGTALAATGLAIEALAMPGLSYLPLAAGMLTLGLGLGFAMGPTNTDALSRVPSESRPQVSGVLGTVRQVGGSVGIAAFAAATGATQMALLGERSGDANFALAASGDLAALADIANDSAAHAEAISILARSTAAGYAVAAVAVFGAFLFALAGLTRKTPADAAQRG
jgi:EmrB/QacA subfamily drug resistance transporter